MVTFIIKKTKLPTLNEYIKLERSNKGAFQAAKLKKQTEVNIVLELLEQKPHKLKTPIKICYEWHEKTKKRDKDNIAFAKKFFQDALIKADLIANDGWEQIEGFSDKFVHDPASENYVKIVIFEKDDLERY